eukprot:3541355-Rhodomonas_salina.1
MPRGMRPNIDAESSGMTMRPSECTSTCSNSSERYASRASTKPRSASCRCCWNGTWIEVPENPTPAPACCWSWSCWDCCWSCW